MAIRTASYGDFQTRLANMIGEPDLFAVSNTLINGFFNKRMDVIWHSAEWVENSVTERRPVGTNLALGKNEIGNSAWTATNVDNTTSANFNTTTIADPWYTNIADKLLETTATATHLLSQTVTQGSDSTIAEVYFHGGLTRTWGYLATNGSSPPSAYFDFSNGVLGTTANVEDASIDEAGNDWYRCRIKHKAPYPGTTYYVGIGEADNDDTFTGNAAKGLYVAGFRVYDAATPVVPYTETDLNPIGEFLQIRNNNPFSSNTFASFIPYQITTDGARYYANNGNSVSSLDPWVKYRKQIPSYTGSDYAASTAYGVDDQAYYPTTGRYYICIAASTGNLPTDTTYWKELEIPKNFFEYVVSASYADWLKQDGQHGKAMAEEGHARFLLTRELDILQRQQRQKAFVDVRTHASAQAR